MTVTLAVMPAVFLALRITRTATAARALAAVRSFSEIGIFLVFFNFVLKVKGFFLGNQNR